MKHRILIADDSRTAVAVLQEMLQDEYEVHVAYGGEECLNAVKRVQPHLVLLDVMMPDLDGYEVCQRIKSDSLGQFIQVLLVTAKTSMDDCLKGYSIGADDYVTKPYDPDILLAKVRVQLRLSAVLRRAREAELTLQSYSSELERIVDARTAGIQAVQDVSVFALAKLADSRDSETGEHLARMRRYSQLLAEQLGVDGPYKDDIDETFLNQLYRSTPLHDIGKVGISDSILLKPGKLTSEEFEVMKQHAVLGAETLSQAASQSPGGSFLEMAEQIARHHHERWDGNGYPDGLKGRAIPLAARIVAVADVFDALTSERVYKPAYPLDTARRMIEEESGSHFDPAVVDAFLVRYEDCVRVARGENDGDDSPVCPDDGLRLPRWRVGAERGLATIPHQQKVLIVHDEPLLRAMMLHWLQAAGFSVREAGDVSQATEQMRDDCPDFLMIRWELPQVGAGELCRWVRQEQLAKYVYTIVITDESHSEGVTESFRCGADDFLCGQLSRDELLGRLRVAGRIVSLEQDLSRQTRNDPLTGVATQRSIEGRMRSEWHRAVCYRLPISCMVVDVDGFGRMNQEFGMEVGDATLQAVAEAIQDNVRSIDLVCRTGGDRFLVQYVETLEHQAALWADRVREAIVARRIGGTDPSVQPTVCIGVAQRMDDMTDFNALVQLAEEALSVAKQQGPNHIVRRGVSSGESGECTPGINDPWAGFTARDIMTAPILYLNQSDSERLAARFLIQRGINSAPVVDQNGRLAGIISEKDLITDMTTLGHWNRPIELTMSRDVISFEESAAAREVFNFLRRAWIRRVIVVDNDRPTGVISRGDLLRWFDGRQSAADAREHEEPVGAASAGEAARDAAATEIVDSSECPIV